VLGYDSKCVLQKNIDENAQKKIPVFIKKIENPIEISQIM
jgi:hypothetical protein